MDIEDLSSLYCIKKLTHSDRHLAVPLSTNMYKINDENASWVIVFSVSDIFQVFAGIVDQQYILVAGNTAKGNEK